MMSTSTPCVCVNARPLVPGIGKRFTPMVKNLHCVRPHFCTQKVWQPDSFCALQCELSLRHAHVVCVLREYIYNKRALFFVRCSVCTVCTARTRAVFVYCPQSESKYLWIPFYNRRPPTNIKYLCIPLYNRRPLVRQTFIFIYVLATTFCYN